MSIKPFRISLALISLLSVFGFNLAAIPGHGSYSLSPGEFNRDSNVCYYVNNGYGILVDGYTTCDTFYAGVHLPEGVTVTKITMYWTDSSEVFDVYLHLWRNNLNDSRESLSGQTSSGSTGTPDNSFALTSFPIDNSQYSYYLDIIMPAPILEFHGVVIEYTYPSYLSVIRK